jgi:transcriptional regulator with XRE-family HTH domain
MEADTRRHCDTGAAVARIFRDCFFFRGKPKRELYFLSNGEPLIALRVVAVLRHNQSKAKKMGLRHQEEAHGLSIPAASRGGNADKQPNPIDVHVGHRARTLRTLHGLSQEKVGDAMGLTFQQVQKYERGINRIGASRLWDMSRVLSCPISYFFDELDEKIVSAGPRSAFHHIPLGPLGENDPLVRRETLELVRAYYSIGDEHIRRRFYDLARSLAAMTTSGKITEREIRDGMPAL